MLRIFSTSVALLLLGAPIAPGQVMEIVRQAGQPVEFPGLDENEADSNRSLPPDPVVAVGPPGPIGSQIVAHAVNKTIRLFTVQGLKLETADFANLAETPNADPRLVFDPIAGRFVLSSAGIVVLVSPPSDDPDFDDLTAWVAVESGAVQDTMCAFGPFAGGIDVPALGFDATAWYVAGAAFPPTQNGSSAAFWIVAKPSGGGPPGVPELVLGTSFPGSPCLDESDPGGTEGPRPAEHFDQPEHTVDGDLVPTPYFVFVVRADTGTQNNCAGLHDTIRIWSIANPLPDEGESRTFHLFDLEAPECFDAAFQYDLSPKENPEDFRAGDARITNAVYREDGADEFLYTVHAVRKDVGGGAFRIVIRWYKTRLNGWPGDGAGDPTLEAHGEIDAGTSEGEQVHLFYPDIAVNNEHDFAIVMHQVSENELVSLRVWGRTAAGTETPILLIHESEDSTIPGSQNEWGDYTDICVDPDGETFWLTGEYVKDLDPDPDIWGTWIAHVQILILP